MPDIDAFLSEVLERKGSDLHFIAGDPPRIRQYGDLMPLRPDKLAAEFVKQALYEIMPKPALDRSSPRTARTSRTPSPIAAASA